MNKSSTKKLVLNGLMIALVFLTTFFTRIPGPVPPGYINFGDTVIFLAAILIGKNTGLLAGAFGSALADIASPGGILFAPITFVVKGVEGYVVGLITSAAREQKPVEIRKVVAVAVGALIMVAGYFAAEATVLKLVDNAFGFAAAMTELPLNLVQGGVSAVLGYILTALLDRVNIRKYLA